jgi:hypothetical protein
MTTYNNVLFVVLLVVAADVVEGRVTALSSASACGPSDGFTPPVGGTRPIDDVRAVVGATTTDMWVRLAEESSSSVMTAAERTVFFEGTDCLEGTITFEVDELADDDDGASVGALLPSSSAIIRATLAIGRLQSPFRSIGK